MLTILILVAGSTTVLVVLLLVIVIIGIHQEPPMEELRSASAKSHDLCSFVACFGVTSASRHSSRTPRCWGR